MWSDFNTANRDAMMRSELISWPVTLAILVLAFGALVAAGLPLLLTILGLASSAGALFLVSQVFEVSIWAMNFALMFALALGIDYALFIVVRFRGVALRLQAPRGRRGRRDHGHRRQGGPLLGDHRPDLAVGGDAGAEPGVPLDGARDHDLGRLHPGRHADPAAGRAREARPQGGPVRPPVGPQRRAPLRALRRLGRAPLAPARCSTGCRPCSRCWCSRSRSSA